MHMFCPVGGVPPAQTMCIRSCKYCDAPCNCACHAGEQAPEGRLFNTLQAAVESVWVRGAGTTDDIVEAVLAALLGMPRTMPDRAADRLEVWLSSERADAEIFRQSGHLAVDLQVLINEFRSLREGGPK